MCVAPPIVGAWSMAVLLWQLFEYYYSEKAKLLENLSNSEVEKKSALNQV
jgi:hypothetical protein